MSQDQIRVFISYSHVEEDRKFVVEIEEALIANGLKPMRDESFAYGTGFHEQIRSYIQHAHVFLPLLTKNSQNRIWVQQEIGYAMAHNIPVLPVTTPGIDPQGMAAQLHGADLEKFKQTLTEKTIPNLVSRYRDARLARYQSAELPEDRAILMTEYANEVIELGFHGAVRQKGGLSSFHLPQEVPTHQTWKQRYLGHEKSLFHCREFREERIALEAHAMQEGFKLIVSPYSYDEDYEEKKEACIARLMELWRFLDELPEAPQGKEFKIVCDEKEDRQESVTIVGNWFAAKSVSVPHGKGYQQTVFTCHAPSMENTIKLFDQEFDEAKAESGGDEVERAMETIAQKIIKLGGVAPVARRTAT